MEYSIKGHVIYFKASLKPVAIDNLPEETMAVLLDGMRPFPLGQLSNIPVADLSTQTIFCDHRRNVLFSASIDQILDIYAERLNRAWRQEQKESVRRLYWQHRQLKLKGVTA